MVVFLDVRGVDGTVMLVTMLPGGTVETTKLPELVAPGFDPAAE